MSKGMVSWRWHPKQLVVFHQCRHSPQVSIFFSDIAIFKTTPLLQIEVHEWKCDVMHIFISEAYSGSHHCLL